MIRRMVDAGAWLHFVTSAETTFKIVVNDSLVAQD
jgi:hypothetical protein